MHPILVKLFGKKTQLIYAGDMSLLLVCREKAARLNPILDQHRDLLPRYWNILTGLTFAFDGDRVQVFSIEEDTLYLGRHSLRLLEDRYCHDLTAIRRITADAFQKAQIHV